jgi:hypothetical protein
MVPDVRAVMATGMGSSITAGTIMYATKPPLSTWGSTTTLRACGYDKYARRFSMVEMTDRIANAVCGCLPFTGRDLCVAEACG